MVSGLNLGSLFSEEQLNEIAKAGEATKNSNQANKNVDSALFEENSVGSFQLDESDEDLFAEEDADLFSEEDADLFSEEDGETVLETLGGLDALEGMNVLYRNPDRNYEEMAAWLETIDKKSPQWTHPLTLAARFLTELMQ